MKDQMKQITLVLFLAFLAFPISAHSADCENGLKVRGKASESVRPDIAYITLYAHANGLLMVDAVKKANNLVEEITKAVRDDSTIIKEIIVEDEGLGQSDSRPWGTSQAEDPPKPQVTKRILIHCEPKPNDIYTIIDKAIRTGASMQVPSSMRFRGEDSSVVAYGVADYSEIVTRLKKLAVDDAKKRAEELAHLAGKKVGDIVGIGCSSSKSFRDSMRFMGQLPNYPTDYIGVNSEKILITHDISVSFELN